MQKTPREESPLGKFIPAVIGDTMIGALYWRGKFTDEDLAFDTFDEAILWLKNNGHEGKTVVK